MTDFDPQFFQGMSRQISDQNGLIHGIAAQLPNLVEEMREIRRKVSTINDALIEQQGRLRDAEGDIADVRKKIAELEARPAGMEKERQDKVDDLLQRSETHGQRHTLFLASAFTITLNFPMAFVLQAILHHFHI